MSSKEVFKYEAHEFKYRVGGKLYCTNCGLMNLNNNFTTWAIRTGCNHKLHPQYNNKRYEFTTID